MTHIWLRAEQRDNEERTPLTPEGAAALMAAGMRVTVEQSAQRAIPIEGYRAAGCTIARAGTWPDAPRDAIILGLKELPEDGTPLPHRHIMFGHAFKGQHSGEALLARFAAGGGALYDLEYLVDEQGRRIAAFGYWAGYVGAAITLKAWAAQQAGGICPSAGTYPGKDALLADLAQDLGAHRRPSVIIIGALGRVGTGAADLCTAMGLPQTQWDQDETSGGGPFPDILAHDIFLNCIFARPGTPVFVPREALAADRRLTAIGDIACDPGSDYNPVPIYEAATDWSAPVRRVHADPAMDVMAIDNLPSLLPLESSLDFAEQLLPALRALDRMDAGLWARAGGTFQSAMAQRRL
ncbi:saccharopine dehydrogenase [Pelagivirga sediminicola]|uniref:Saccharopine dehydrogenase [NAD(+), L-lysine-forming] n=1 Tax=Pelagivirga sediminicola TaxID=2170575 RepID=A0A2T7G8Q3_9RHOB|nr:saccharopine dehydrogenase [Pelagivirga sediminicola]PVA10793.1 saccharopine dehydrogenase [Pelagivirga sediminicola]